MYTDKTEDRQIGVVPQYARQHDRYVFTMMGSAPRCRLPSCQPPSGHQIRVTVCRCLRGAARSAAAADAPEDQAMATPSAAATSSENLGVRFSRVRVPLPLAGSLLFGATRIFCLALTWLLLSYGTIARRDWSLRHWMISWDAHFYLILATRGYGFHWPEPLPGGSLYPWFPGYPAAIASIDWIPGIHPGVAGVLVTGIAGLLAAGGLTRLGMLLTGDRRVSLLLVALWSGVPGTFVFSMVYPEALYCAFAVWALVALTRRRWLTARR
jgi:hypothetical protein